ncbi:hypothetical protein ACIPRD_17620 [Streptomyces sp. NPDC090108]|uniref:hypothetical protein n=1 Tax=Streptomyces sp. NPDC090108 TaxID=3365947 RepID=UPI0037F618C5
MTGTIAVYAHPPRFRRGGVFAVAVDGVTAGHVRQGEAARFPVTPGTHTVRILAKDRTRSNTVTVDVVEGRDFLVTTRSTGLIAGFLIPLVLGFSFPYAYTLGALLLLGAACWAVPGLLFRVRAEGVHERRTARSDTGTGTPAGNDAPAGNGLWWESDPVLAKRIRDRSGS